MLLLIECTLAKVFLMFFFTPCLLFKLQICPQLILLQLPAMEILHSLRPDVNDLYSITAKHYINAGMEGAQHFAFLLNILISNVNFHMSPHLDISRLLPI